MRSLAAGFVVFTVGCAHVSSAPSLSSDNRPWNCPQGVCRRYDPGSSPGVIAVGPPPPSHPSSNWTRMADPPKTPSTSEACDGLTAVLTVAAILASIAAKR